MTINTGQYVHLNEALDTVETEPGVLPQNDPYSGKTNINNTDLYNDTQLRSLRWYPYTLIDTGFPDPSDAYNRALEAYVIGALEVTQTARYDPKELEVLRELRNGQLERNRLNPTPFELILDDLTRYRVTDMERWIADEQIALAKLVDWQTIADFVTDPPKILPLDNQYVAQQYQEQGAALTAVNQAATGSGQAAPHDQAEIDAFVTANEPAATDTTGATAPVPPNAKLRQFVANVSEERSVLWMFRTNKEGEEGDTYLNSRLTGKLDNRPLYKFIWLKAGAFLAWYPFVQDPVDPTIWVAKSDDNIITWVPQDLRIRYSLSDNFAVEEAMITDDIFFEAGAKPIKTLIRWDRDPLEVAKV